MDLDQLRAFVETARHGSFSIAARILGLTQPGVSRQVQQLERELGTTLLEREQRPVALSPAGKKLLPCVERILSDWDSTIRQLSNENDDLAGPLLVAASTIPGEFLVPGLLARFTARHPKVRPSLLLTDSAGVAEELLARQAEVGFMGAPMANRRLHLVPFAADEIVLAVPSSHPFAGRHAVSLADLAGQAFVEREGGSGTLDSLRRLLAQQERRLPDHQVGMVVGSSQAQLAAIEAGVGLGFLSSLALASRPNLKVAGVKIEGVTLRRTLYLAHDPAALSPVAQSFVRFVVEKEE